MANVKISDLPAASTPLSGTELVPIVQSGVTSQTTTGAVIAPLAASSGSASIGYLPSGTGAVATTVQTKLRETVSVKDFGAVGDGVTDDTNAINAALLTGGQIYMPAGTYLISSPIKVSNYTSLVGEDRFTTIIKLKNSSNCNLIEPLDITNGGIGCGIYNLSFDGNQNNNTKGGVYLLGASYPTVSRGPTWIAENITVSYCREVDFASGFKPAVYVGGNQWSILSNIDIVNNDYAQAGLWAACADSQFNGVYVGTNGTSRGSASYGLYITSGGNFFNTCYFGGTQLNAQVYLNSASSNTFNNCIVDNAGTDGVWLATGSIQNKFIGGQIGNSSFSYGGTYYSILSDTNTGNNLFSGVTIYSQYSTAYATNAYKESTGTTGGNYLVGCQFLGTWTSGIDGRTANSTSYISAGYGFDSSDFGTVTAHTKINVNGPYTSAAPSTSSVPLLRLNNGGTISLWAGAQGYSNFWFQAIQDDGSNTAKPIWLNPLGGLIRAGGNGGGITVTSPDGLVTKTITINNAGVLTLI